MVLTHQKMVSLLLSSYDLEHELQFPHVYNEKVDLSLVYSSNVNVILPEAMNLILFYNFIVCPSLKRMTYLTKCVLSG